MTSVKCFSNWLKEAGRGHLTALFGWMAFFIYAVLLVMRLSLDTSYTFFGIGNMVLLWMSIGLGLLFSFLEFFYLLQQKKQDFYYSLPVKKEMIFWSRYVHGMIHFFLPFLLMISICGIWQAMIDPEFAPVVGSYTSKSILAFGLTFLIFYHIGILCISVCGNFICAVLLCVSLIVYSSLFIENVITVFAKNYFVTYYKRELFKKLINILSPFGVARQLTGIGVYEKRVALQYPLPVTSVIAAVVWAAALFVLFFFAQKKRKPECVGTFFMFRAVQRLTEILLSFLAGAWFAAFVAELMKTKGLFFGLAESLCGAAAALFVSCLIELSVKRQGIHMFRRKGQLAAVSIAAACIGPAMMSGARSYDGYFPKEAEAVSVVIEGVGMSHDEYGLLDGRENTVTEKYLYHYRMTGEGKAAALQWAKGLADTMGGRKKPEGKSEVTQATVCYETKSGSRHYRTYPVTEEKLRQFSLVYETKEYKTLAYEGVLLEKVGADKLSWNDGIFSQIMKIKAEEKEELLKRYKEDVFEFRMEQLTEALPCGILEVSSSLDGGETELIIYPFFERTCEFLENNGIDLKKQLKDYPVESVEIKETSAVPAGVSGGSYVHFYEEPEEVDQWKDRLFPKVFDVQQVLCPMDRSRNAEAVVCDEETASYVKVKCILKL